jgi:EmrB/QacA subfamily drug resistance transporter
MNATDASPPHPLGDRRLVVIGLMLSMALAALDSTIVATAIPSIVRVLGGFALFPWVFSAYLLVQAVTIPIYGKLADLYGRKPVLLAGIAVFVLGSALSGASWSMTALILFRAVQGVGAGAVQPVTMTVIGDLFTVEERARVQGYFSSVFGIASVIGPAIGGLLVQFASWHWIFYINVPIGIAAAFMVTRHFREQVARRHHRIDYLGAAALALCVGGLVLDLLEGGVGWAWLSTPSVALIGASALCLVAFIRIEQRAPEPTLPLWVFRRPMLVGTNMASLTIGALSVGLSSFLPVFVEGTMGGTPLVAGAVLGAMSLAWPLASSQSGRLYLRIGFRNTAMLGSLIAILSGVLFVLLPASARPWQAGVASFCMGIGLGFCAVTLIVSVQSAVDWGARGTVTGAQMFTRMVGSTLGAAVFGALLNAALVHWFASAPSGIRRLLPHSLSAASLALSPGLGGVNQRAVAYVREGLFLGVHHIFLGLGLAAVLTFAALWVMPGRADRPAEPSEPRARAVEAESHATV